MTRDPGLRKALSGCELNIGLASDDRFAVPASAQDAVFVGDAAWIEGKNIDAATEALLQVDPSRVQIRPRYNPRTNKWIMDFSPLAGDTLDPIAGQLFSPWNISFMARVFKEPLSYSNVDKLVSYESGGNPWAEIFTLFMEQYSGWAMAGQTGSLQSNVTSDVNVKDGMMSAPVINISGTYSLTLEEQHRGTPGPFGQSPMTRKQSYLNYAINMLKAYIAFYGNEETDTDGFMQVNPVEIWSGNSLADIWAGASVTKGYDAYKLLAEIVNNMLTISDNKFDHLVIAMAPEALNILRSMPYSNNYDPTAAMKIFMENYGATTKGGGVPTVEFVAEPMLKANSIFNPNATDYMVISAPSVGAGPTDEKQPTVIFGAPLQKFVFPAIPGQYNTQYKTLARLAGILAPVPAAVRVVQGFGK
jgi:hypothetical protein